jgi:hypothetical protein
MKTKIKSLTPPMDKAKQALYLLAMRMKTEIESAADYHQPWVIAPTPMGWRLENDHPQAAVVEYGRAAGSRPPPTEVIREWCVTNGIDPEHAYVIARSIGEDGIPAQYVVRDVMDAHRYDRIKV